MRITFPGAAGTVTGSKYLLDHRNQHVLIDCGLFQGYKHMTIQLRCAGHILGAATVAVIAGGQTLVCSGDLGRPDDPLMFAPEAVEQADYLLVESTYGDRQHPDESPQAQLAEVITRTALRRGISLVPPPALWACPRRSWLKAAQGSLQL